MFCLDFWNEKIPLTLGGKQTMAKELMWGDTEDIGIRLQEEYPDLDPLTVRFTDLHAWVVALPEFKDDPKNSNEKKLEAIQMAWYEEYKDAQS
jgi:FeS assembly protein IscX